MTPAPTLDIPPLPPAIQVHAPSAPPRASLPTYPPVDAPAPREPRPVKPFPLVPSEFWDTHRAVVWQVENPRSLFWRGAEACGLRYTMRGVTMEVKTTVEELAKLLIWAWDEKREVRR